MEQNYYARKIGNVYLVCYLDAWPRNPINNFKFKNWLFEATSVVKKSDKEKYPYSGYRTTFANAVCSWSFDNDIARNVIIFGVHNSSSSHADNHKNDFLVLSEGISSGINGRFRSPEKKK